MRVAGIAVLRNPFAGSGDVADLSPLFEIGRALGERMMFGQPRQSFVFSLCSRCDRSWSLYFTSLLW